eukprot:CAMPEP_0115296240 /NCGR_PEP_ID=MMETSP0270-20121206/67129_1 /TAXON_ID=71861 /ORGANISM="Scrippsiella trochoidea, Strain CCMP3099" /LENGTH=72 /DNA_ID=CAMNT_0002713857 /DNA_START=847 /DNA_END=1065 /DNA_ORIENTATION=+
MCTKFFASERILPAMLPSITSKSKKKKRRSRTENMPGNRTGNTWKRFIVTSTQAQPKTVANAKKRMRAWYSQ